MDLSNWTAYLSAAKTALDIFKGIRAEIPKGPKADEAQRQIEKAEQALRVSEVELAKALGYNLCQCTFPPSVMLWSEKEQAHLCPNPNCRRRIERPKPVRVARRLGGRKVL
ncbi:MAG: hypothetical protein M3Z96_01830 [Pseudomonadota bacterium]|nr:hypothetical protein [Pseudomonadota bacterium]